MIHERSLLGLVISKSREVLILFHINYLIGIDISVLAGYNGHRKIYLNT